MKYVTIRNLPPDVALALEREKKRRGKSLNQTTVELLAQALGVARQKKRGNGLSTLAGGWTLDQWRSFEESIALTEQVDEELWR
jgi:plasmid stability protein